MAAPEDATMTACNRAMINGLEAADLDSVADELLEVLLIAPDVYSGLQLQTKTKKQKAREVVISVASKVRTNPKEEFSKFLGILCHYEDLKHLVKTLEDTYKDKGGTLHQQSVKEAPIEHQSAGQAGQAFTSGDVVASSVDVDVEYLQEIMKVLDTDQLKKKYERFKGKIKKGLGKLDEDIESDQHLRLIAEKIDNWQIRSDLLQLSHNPDVQDILGKYGSDPFKQKKYALIKWKNRVVYPTYHSLLCICVAAQWSDSADVITEILDKEETGEITDILETKDLRMKYKKYMAKIPKDKLSALNEDISDQRHLHHIAEKLTGWEDKPDLLGLKENPDVQTILAAKKDPYAQKREALEKWRNKDISPTYHKLLCICIAGSWMDAVTQIIQFFK